MNNNIQMQHQSIKGLTQRWLSCWHQFSLQAGQLYAHRHAEHQDIEQPTQELIHAPTWLLLPHSILACFHLLLGIQLLLLGIQLLLLGTQLLLLLAIFFINIGQPFFLILIHLTLESELLYFLAHRIVCFLFLFFLWDWLLMEVDDQGVFLCRCQALFVYIWILILGKLFREPDGSFVNLDPTYLQFEMSYFLPFLRVFDIDPDQAITNRLHQEAIDRSYFNAMFEIAFDLNIREPTLKITGWIFPRTSSPSASRLMPKRPFPLWLISIERMSSTTLSLPIKDTKLKLSGLDRDTWIYLIYDNHPSHTLRQRKMEINNFNSMFGKEKVISKLKYKSIKTEILQSTPDILFPKIVSENSAITNQICVTQASQSPNSRSVEKKWKIKNSHIDHQIISRGKSHTEIRQSCITLQEGAKVDRPSRKAKIFFTNISINSVSQDSQEVLPSKQQLYEAIHKSKEFISIIKNQRKKIIKLQISSLDPNKSALFDFKRSQQKPKEIYNYLSREFVVGKDRQIDDDVLNRYVSHSPNKKLQPIEDQSRRFLLKKMYSDYGNHSQVQKFKKEHIRSLIISEIGQKRQHFTKDYKQRYNIPYFSFLTLTKQEQNSVLGRQARKSLV